MGRAGVRRPGAVREADPRRLPGRAVLDHDPEEAREFPPRLFRLRSCRDRGLRPRARRGADVRCRHRPQPAEDPRHHRRRPGLARDPGAAGLRDVPVGVRRRPPGAERPREPGRYPAENETSRAISKALKAEGFNFVGPTIVYAFMQAVGMVNDHLTGCFRHAEALKRAQARSAEGPRPSGKAPRAWQRMLSGRRLDLLDPSPLDIEIEDIAHGLARVARWNGQTVGDHIFSVAQHSLLVEGIPHTCRDLTAAARLTALLHDAPEYVLGDLISPFKAVIGESYKAVESRLRARSTCASGCRRSHPPTLTRADQASRPDRRLSRSDTARRLRARGGAEVFRPSRSHPDTWSPSTHAMGDRSGTSPVCRAFP